MTTHIEKFEKTLSALELLLPDQLIVRYWLHFGAQDHLFMAEVISEAADEEDGGLGTYAHAKFTWSPRTDTVNRRKVLHCSVREDGDYLRNILTEWRQSTGFMNTYFRPWLEPAAFVGVVTTGRLGSANHWSRFPSGSAMFQYYHAFLRHEIVQHICRDGDSVSARTLENRFVAFAGAAHQESLIAQLGEQ